MALKKTFGIEFSKDPAENKKIFKSVKTLADFIEGSMV
jgi:acyl carrier protein